MLLLTNLLTNIFLGPSYIVYSKIFQALSSGINFLSLEEMNALSRYNDNAPYTKNEIYNIAGNCEQSNRLTVEKIISNYFR